MLTMVDMIMPMRESVYLETSVVSYLTARESRDLIVTAIQQLTKEWWNKRRDDFDLYVSDMVVQESQAGDPLAANRRIEIIRNLPVIALSDEVLALAEELARNVPLPAKAVEDAVHIACATVNEIDYLLSWNCKHIANAVIIPKVNQVCIIGGYRCPTICTPQELMEKSE